MAKVSKQKPSSSSSDVLSRIAPIKAPEGGMKCNYYGRSGTGKTTLACTFPKPLLLIGAEDGTRSVHNVKGVKFVRLHSPEELPVLIEHAQETGEYKTVVLDTASSFQDLVLREILGGDLPAQLSFGTVSRDQWGECAIKMKEYLRLFNRLADDAGINTIVLAQERNFGDDNESSDALIPCVCSGVSPSVAAWLNPECDYIGNTVIRSVKVKVKVKVNGKEVEKTKDSIKYGLRIGAHPIYVTKFRAPKGKTLPEVLDDPSYEKFVALANG